MHALRLSIALLIALAVVGCRQEQKPVAKSMNYAQELPPGELALRKIPPAMYPDFSSMQTDQAALIRAIDNSLTYLAAPSSKRFFPYADITHDRAVATLKALRELASSDNADWNAEIRNRFDVYQSIGAPTPDPLAGPTPSPGYSGEVLYTGYFTPIYNASLTRGGPYQWPVYKRPADLVSDETGEAVYRRAPNAAGGPTSIGTTAIAPVADNRYWTRAEIERDGKLQGQELAWLTSRWEAYVVTVQGSARLKLTDGRTYEIGFAGTNGQPYVSPGRQMLADGVIKREQLSLKGLGQYFTEHPEHMDQYLWLNPRTTFFTERPGGPYGKLNVPVTAFATIATDKEVYPRAMPAFLTTTIPTAGGGSRPFRGFMLDQDTGGAIRSAGRADIYMGIGPQAEQLAGRQLFPGKLYYLAVRF